MMNGSRFALSGLTVFDITHAATSDVTTLNAYIATISSAWVIRDAGISAPITSVYTGNRAEHVISGTTIIVRIRSRRRSIVRVAVIAGTAHAKPNSIGTNARPCRFICFITRSMRYVTRAR